jgi:CDP-paratose 2-epimerase
MRVMVTGASGLVGSEAALAFGRDGAHVVGIDNNLRADFFGPGGDTLARRAAVEAACPAYRHVDLDIRDQEGVADLVASTRPDVVIHCAAQPSHDLAKDRPFDDFDVNARGTLNVLEALRRHAPRAVLCFASTNKVYGDAPNRLPLVELDTRWDYAHAEDREGIDEGLSIDGCLHSLFGVSKAAADLLCQEYGRNFGLNVGVFRAGCITGSAHAGVPLHGFLSYLVKVCVRREPYTILGFKGKQVRDQIHAADLVRAFRCFVEAPRPGEVYNIGGGRENSASILECISRIEARLGTRAETRYVEEPRVGDHICYITNLGKLRAHYPTWSLERSLDDILDEMVAAERDAAA